MTDAPADAPADAKPTYPNRIRELRLASGAPLRVIADASGISLQQINRLELGQRRLTDDAKVAIAKALQVEPWELEPQTEAAPVEEEADTAPMTPPPPPPAPNFAAAYAAIGIGSGNPIATVQGFPEATVKAGQAGEVLSAQLVKWLLNPRRDPAPGAIEELANSIALQGVLQPLLVREIKGRAQYEVIAGERRRLAVQLLIRRGRIDASLLIPVRVVEISDTDALFAAGAENLAREGMHPLDETELFAALVAQGFDKASIASRLGTSVRTVERRLFLGNMIEPARELFRSSKLSQAQAEALAGAPKFGQEQLVDDPRLMEMPPWQIRQVALSRLPTESEIAFDLTEYQRRGGEVIEDEECGARYLASVALAIELQREEIERCKRELEKEFSWVDVHVTLNPLMYPFDSSGCYRTKGVDQVSLLEHGAVLLIEKDGWNLEIVHPVLRPAALTPEPQQVEMFGGQRADVVRSLLSDDDDQDEHDQDAGEDEPRDATREPRQPSEPEARDGEASRLMTYDQIKAVRAVQSKAMRQAMAQNPKAALAYAILIHLEAVPALHVTTPHYLRAPGETAELTEAVIKLAAIWDGAPDPAKINFFHDLSRWFRENDYRAADCFRALATFADEAALLELQAALIACRVANWHGADDRSPTSSSSPLTVAVATQIRADLFMTYHWRPDADYWKGYDRVGLKAALAAGGQDLVAFKRAGKNDLIAACASLDGPATLGIPELAFMIAGDQQDAVIEARGRVIKAERESDSAQPTEPAEAA